jgi:hypothetical protein
MPCFCLPGAARRVERRARLRQAVERVRLPNFEQAAAAMVAIPAERLAEWVDRRVIARVAPEAAHPAAAATVSEA